MSREIQKFDDGFEMSKYMKEDLYKDAFNKSKFYKNDWPIDEDEHYIF